MKLTLSKKSVNSILYFICEFILVLLAYFFDYFYLTIIIGILISLFLVIPYTLKDKFNINLYYILVGLICITLIGVLFSQQYSEIRTENSFKSDFEKKYGLSIESFELDLQKGNYKPPILANSNLSQKDREILETEFVKAHILINENRVLHFVITHPPLKSNQRSAT